MSSGKVKRVSEDAAGGTPRTAESKPARETPAVSAEDEVELASADSFPASDPPSWTGSIIG